MIIFFFINYCTINVQVRSVRFFKCFQLKHLFAQIKLYALPKNCRNITHNMPIYLLIKFYNNMSLRLSNCTFLIRDFSSSIYLHRSELKMCKQPWQHLEYGLLVFFLSNCFLFSFVIHDSNGRKFTCSESNLWVQCLQIESIAFSRCVAALVIWNGIFHSHMFKNIN